MRTLLVTAALLAILGASPAPAANLPTEGRKVVLEKADKGYRWKLISAPVRSPGAGEVLVRVHAVSLNRGDLEMLEPNGGGDASGLQVTSDMAGEVLALGAGVKDVRVGDKVTSLYFRDYTDGPPTAKKLSGAHGSSIDGVLGDYVVLPQTALAPIPGKLTYEQASTLPTAGLTAWMATLEGQLGPDDVVLVQGTGGVSIFALQFAAAAGARVIATSSSDEKLARVRALGARDTINYRSVPQWSARVQEITGGRGADLVVDVGGKSSLPESVKSLAYAGNLSIVGGLTGYGGDIPALGLLLKTARAQGIYVGSRADYLRMGEYMAARKIEPVIDRVFALQQYPQALEHMASGNFIGKIVIRVE